MSTSDQKVLQYLNEPRAMEMVMACPPGPVTRLLTMTSLDDRLIFAPDRPGALAQARSS
jgi:hypothetical protein